MFGDIDWKGREGPERLLCSALGLRSQGSFHPTQDPFGGQKEPQPHCLAEARAKKMEEKKEKTLEILKDPQDCAAIAHEDKDSSVEPVVDVRTWAHFDRRDRMRLTSVRSSVLPVWGQYAGGWPRCLA